VLHFQLPGEKLHHGMEVLLQIEGTGQDPADVKYGAEFLILSYEFIHVPRSSTSG